jgi:hypothetical protein
VKNVLTLASVVQEGTCTSVLGSSSRAIEVRPSEPASSVELFLHGHMTDQWFAKRIVCHKGSYEICLIVYGSGCQTFCNGNSSP